MTPAPATAALTAARLDALASGYGGADDVEALFTGQLGRRKLLVRAVFEQLSEASPGRADRFAADCATLTTIEQADPDAVRGRSGALAHPYLGFWATRLLHDLFLRSLDDGALASRLGWFTGLVAVAAIRSRQSVELDLPAPSGRVLLPGVAQLQTAPLPRITIRTSDGELTVHDPAGAELPTAWQTVRSLSAGIQLEDLDPFRDAFGRPPTPRLTDHDAATWADRFDQAWTQIKEHHSAYLPALAAGLRSLTPLTPPTDGTDASAASRHAFGAVGIGLPPTAARLALLVIHEFQHVKLGGVLDLVDLYDDTDRTLYTAPWRPDQRPLPALFQGCYAYLGVADFWRVRREVEPDPEAAAEADRQFRRWRDHTARGIADLAASPALTELGRRFAGGMAATIDGASPRPERPGAG